MTTRSLVDPELLGLLDNFPFPDTSAKNLTAYREAVAALEPSETAFDQDKISIVRRTIVQGEGGCVDVIMYRPARQAEILPAMLHIHGGGYVLGRAMGSAYDNVATAIAAQCVVVSVDYRLAPEAQGLCAVEDCYAALAWMHDEAGALGIDRRRIAVGGESAGAGLAAALALLARDRKAYDICFQMLIYPMLDDRAVTKPVLNPHVGEFVWTAASNAFGWRSLIGGEPGQDELSPYIAAARASDLANLPPAYIAVGALDLFLEENFVYAQRLLRAGVPVEFHVFPGAYHSFELAAKAAVSKRAIAERRQALVRAFASQAGLSGPFGH